MQLTGEGAVDVEGRAEESRRSSCIGRSSGGGGGGVAASASKGTASLRRRGSSSTSASAQLALLPLLHLSLSLSQNWLRRTGGDRFQFGKLGQVNSDPDPSPFCMALRNLLGRVFP